MIWRMTRRTISRRTRAILAGALSVACTGVHATTTPAPRARTQRQARARIDSVLNAPAFASAHWGVLIVNPRTGDTLYAHDAHKMFLPASNMKIVTASTALTQLGPDFRTRTTFVAGGGMRNGVIRGDLIVVGGGDPSASDAMRGDALSVFRDIADSLQARGITQIRGRVVKGGDAFPDGLWGAGWYWDELDATYAAAVDELMLNEGIARIVAHGGTARGDPVTVTTSPARSYPEVRVEAATDSAGARSRITAEYDETGRTVVVRGTVAPHDSVSRTLAYRDPASAYLAALREVLEQRGISLGRRRAPPGDSTRRARRVDTLFTILSPPLSDVVRAMAKPSQNQIAEILLRTIGLGKTGVGSVDSGRRVVREQFAAWKIPVDNIAMFDGSGLSRSDIVSPFALVSILTAMRADSVFTSALPVAGVDGTLASRMRGTPAQGNVQAKTGTLARARSLSGYVHTADGEQLIFSLLCNNFTASSEAVGNALDTIAATLASMAWRRR
jgi:D-alanyl-D-alanine carboxypeptidase/D-alanyl-D-alanine-endopeptidase (penicillin-binding protein 4)